jgi:hypothetical protein
MIHQIWQCLKCGDKGRTSLEARSIPVRRLSWCLKTWLDIYQYFHAWDRLVTVWQYYLLISTFLLARVKRRSAQLRISTPCLKETLETYCKQKRSDSMTFDFGSHTHRRLNPLLNSWVMVAPHRMQRPWRGEEESTPTSILPAYDPQCYLCPDTNHPLNTNPSSPRWELLYESSKRNPQSRIKSPFLPVREYMTSYRSRTWKKSETTKEGFDLSLFIPTKMIHLNGK